MCRHLVLEIYMGLLELMIRTKLVELADIRKWHGLQILLVLHILGSSYHTSYYVLLSSSSLPHDRLTTAIYDDISSKVLLISKRRLEALWYSVLGLPSPPLFLLWGSNQMFLYPDTKFSCIYKSDRIQSNNWLFK